MTDFLILGIYPALAYLVFVIFFEIFFYKKLSWKLNALCLVLLNPLLTYLYSLIFISDLDGQFGSEYAFILLVFSQFVIISSMVLLGVLIKYLVTIQQKKKNVLK